MLALRNKSPHGSQSGRKIVKTSPLHYKALEKSTQVGGSPPTVTARQLNYKALAHSASDSFSAVTY